MSIEKQLLCPVQETLLPLLQTAVVLQLGQAEQVFVPLVEPVHDPLCPDEQLEGVTPQDVPEQLRTEPFQQVTEQVDLAAIVEASWGCGAAARSDSGAGAKIAARASSAVSAGVARAGRAQTVRLTNAIPKASFLLIANPP